MNAAVSPIGSNLVEILVHSAAAQPQRIAYHFMGDEPENLSTLDCATLLKESASLATLIQQQRLRGKPVLLACKSNHLFISAFYACLMAGAIAVPTAPPRRASLEQRLHAISVQACIAGVISDSDAVLAHPSLRGLAVIDLRRCQEANWPDAHRWEPPQLTPDAPACILYTSGTVAEPHGVLFDHGSLITAALAAAVSFRHPGPGAALITLPLFHDVGLLLGVLHPLICASRIFLSTPAQFVQKPQRWLRLLQQHRITIAGGPNFMFDIVIRNIRPEQLADVSLSCLQALFCTGEPIRSATLSMLFDLLGPLGLRQAAIVPAYSLTEACGLVTGSITGAPARTDAPGIAGIVHPLVGCGKPQAGRELLIVDPIERREQPAGAVGEIWVRGAALGSGYWKNPLLSEAVFAAMLADGRGPFLRTGDVAYLKEGHLYHIGRLTDRMRLHGRDHYPQDLEFQAERSHPAIRPSSTAAFTVDARERPRLVIACELRKEFLRRREKWAQIESSVRAAIHRVHGLHVDHVVLLMPGTLPKTSSGKVRRNQCRRDYLENRLAVAHGAPQHTQENMSSAG
ncbi:AMP-binding protein [Noviherbaspirillum pedocola]|uniref:AMP-binding protein n=1 Tax=Noviherbaspirillum pedocola TaxID=2801341 RepID=A0A934W620_9BURK|nr:AMP-binding protein [Noviherbaspirillum pedocola]MBK4735672.1 AMP-binding protein [Noviherbaspirillum pedocola]